MACKVEGLGKWIPSFTDWLIKTGLGQFEKKLRQVGIKDVSSFTELDNDDLNEMKINDAKSRLALMSVVQYMNERSKVLSHKHLPLLMKQDSMEPTSFSEHSDKVSIAIVGSTGSGKTNLAVQFISGKSIVEHEATLIDTYNKEISVDKIKCLVTLIDCGEEFGENLDVASTDGFIICHKANNMASLNFALKLVDEIITIKDTTTLMPDTKWPICLVRTHHEQIESGSLLMLPEKYTNLNLSQYNVALGEVSYTDCCVRQMVQSIRSHRKCYSRPQEISLNERKRALIGYWVLQSAIGGDQSWNSSEFPIMELDKWSNVRWHWLSHEPNSIRDVSVTEDDKKSVLLSSTNFVVSPMWSQVTFNSEQGMSVSFLFAFDKDSHLIMQYEDDKLKDDFKLVFNWLNQLPYPDLLPVSLSSYLVDAKIPESCEVTLVAVDKKRFQIHSAILNARCLSDDVKQLTSVDLPYSSNVIKSFLVYLYTNAPPLSAVNQISKESPVLSDAELTDLAQLAKQFGLPQLVRYCNLPRDTSLQLEIEQPPSDVSEMFKHFGLEMDRTCFYIALEHHILNEEALAEDLSAKKQLGNLVVAAIGANDVRRCAYQKIFSMLHNYHNTWKRHLLKSQKRAFLSITLEWFKDLVDRYYKYLMDIYKEFRVLWSKPENQASALEYTVYMIEHLKSRDADVFTKNAQYFQGNLDTFLEAAMKAKPKSLIQMGRNIPKVFKIRKTIKSLQQFKKQLPFLTAEIIKEIEFIASNYKHPDAYKRCKECVTALVDFINSKENLLHKFKKKIDNMSLKEWKTFVSNCGGKLNYFINNVKSMKLSYANHLWMSQTSGRPRRLGRIFGVDMAWEVGMLNQRPDLEFPAANKKFLQAMDEYSETNDDKYLEFHKYQNSISEVFGETITRKTKVTDSSEDQPQQNSSNVESAQPTDPLIPIAGLGMDLQYLLQQDCPVPFDIHFQLDDGSMLGAHSVVVCARCSWFMNALESGMKESVNRKIPLPGVSSEAAHAFIFVLYTGNLPEGICNQPMNHVGVLAEMMCLSHRLELYDMFSICEVKLLYCINEENAIDLLTYADGLQAQILYGKCVQYITSHTVLFNSEELKGLSPRTKTFFEIQFIRADGHGRQSPQQLASHLKPFYFKQMSRCEAYNIAQVVKAPQLETKKIGTERSLTDDTKTVSIQDIIKDLRLRAKAAQDTQD